MNHPIIECVPNYSEGRDRSVIDAIVAAIAAVEGVKVLDVDPGEATNRTVVTFVGAPEPVMAAAFEGAKKAQELIDMRQHHGAHPRSGACDVLPLIPVSDITLEECAALARQLAERLYKELGIGKLIGTPVAGTATSVWWERLIDPTIVFGIPQVGKIDNRGQYTENNELFPDIEVYNTPEDYIQGRDRQLERAVEEMMKQIK